MVEITLQSVQIGTQCADTEGRLAFANGKLVAVLVRLSDELHGSDGRAGYWCLEAGFGACEARPLSVHFDTLEAASAWLTSRMRRE
ncbi:hypothetical protein [Methylobacterium sp. CM6257]|jgi:hypothetical protein